MTEGTGGPERRLDDLEADYWGGLRKAASQITDTRRRQLAIDLFESGSVEEVSEKVDQIRRGTWLDNLMLGGAAVAGAVLGYKAQEMIDIRANGVPVTGLLGLGGVIPGVAMNRTLTARNVVGLGGLLFLAGAGLYTSANPIEEAGEEPGEKQEGEGA